LSVLLLLNEADKVSSLGEFVQMLNIEAFQELCRRASQEKDPAELETLKETLRFMLKTEEIELCDAQRIPVPKLQ
jgi:hypothetical protein